MTWGVNLDLVVVNIPIIDKIKAFILNFSWLRVNLSIVQSQLLKVLLREFGYTFVPMELEVKFRNFSFVHFALLAEQGDSVFVVLTCKADILRASSDKVVPKLLARLRGLLFLGIGKFEAFLSFSKIMDFFIADGGSNVVLIGKFDVSKFSKGLQVASIDFDCLLEKLKSTHFLVLANWGLLR